MGKITPVVIGKNRSKGIFVIRSKNGINVCICKLKPGFKSGDHFNLGDVINLLCILTFEDQESVERTIKVLEKVVKDMKVR